MSKKSSPELRDCVVHMVYGRRPAKETPGPRSMRAVAHQLVDSARVTGGDARR